MTEKTKIYLKIMGAAINVTNKTLKKPIDFTILDEMPILYILKSVSIEGNRDENATHNGIKDINEQTLMAYSELKTQNFPEILSIKKNKPIVERMLKEGIIDS